MSSMKKSARRAVKNGGEQVKRVGKVAGSATSAAAKAGLAAALAAGTLAAVKGWKETSPAAVRSRLRKKIVAVVLGAAAVTAAAVGMARSKRAK